MTISKQDLKNILKPLIKECVRESLLETGILSKIITEVATGLNNVPHREVIHSNVNIPQFSSKTSPTNDNEQAKALREDMIREKKERMEKIAQASGMPNSFRGLEAQIIKEVEYVAPEPIRQENISPEERTKILKEEKEDAAFGFKGGTALKGMDASDPGININGILNVVGGKSTWKKFLKE